MMGRVIALIAVVAMASQAPRPPRTIEKGDQSRVETARQVVMRDATEWRTLWNQHASDRPLPAVDFANESVVAIFMGQRSTSGYSVSIVSTTEGNGVLIVRYKETTPTPDAITAQILTAPFHIVAIPKTSATRVQFEKAS